MSWRLRIRFGRRRGAAGRPRDRPSLSRRVERGGEEVPSRLGVGEVDRLRPPPYRYDNSGYARAEQTVKGPEQFPSLVRAQTSAYSTEDSESPKGKPGFNGLTPREWTLYSRSVWTAREVSSPREAFHLEHGATFSIALAERAIRMYSAANDIVLDPFVGTGTTAVAARNLGRNAIGFELYPKYVEIARSRLRQTSLLEEINCRIVEGNCLDLVKTLTPETVQLTFTSPPYANFIHRSVTDRSKTHKHSLLVSDNNSRTKPYGKDDRDFGNLPYDSFLTQVRELMIGVFRATKPGGYNVWVVKDCRDPQKGRPFIEFHSDIAAAGRRAGFVYHDLIVWDQNDQRSLILLGYPTTFYVNINHSFLVVMRRPREE